jgi:hypothetical protein
VTQAERSNRRSNQQLTISCPSICYRRQPLTHQAPSQQPTVGQEKTMFIFKLPLSEKSIKTRLQRGAMRRSGAHIFHRALQTSSWKRRRLGRASPSPREGVALVARDSTVGSRSQLLSRSISRILPARSRTR